MGDAKEEGAVGGGARDSIEHILTDASPMIASHARRHRQGKLRVSLRSLPLLTLVVS